ncbi:MAG: restriction endonuclease subunit S [Bacteroidales bacterium]|nr:restriction endonuclease subunit S [Bacteroidales bacterium]
MPYGLKDTELEKLRKTFAANERIERVVLYGSRAKGNYKPFSDVDITLEGAELTHTDLNRISLAIDDLLLPYQFDISIFHTLKNEALIDHIRRMGITIFEKKSEWKEYKLGEIASFVKEKISVQEIDLEDYISTENMLADKGGITTASNKPNEGTITRFFPNTILISNIRPYFKKIWFSDRYGGCSNDVLCFEPTKKLVDDKYLFFLLSQDVFFDYVMLGSKGCKMPRGDKSHIMNWEVSLPPLPTQRRIAAILSSLDDKIDLLHRENATLEQMSETLFRQWFVVEAKEEWEEVPLGNVVKTTSGGTPSRKHSEYYENGTINWVKSKELNGSFISATEELITKEAVAKSSAKMLPEKSVLIAMYGATVGEYGILSKPMTCNQAVCALIPNENYPYTYLYVWTALMKEDFINLASGAAQQNISQDLIKQQIVCSDIDRIKQYDEMVRGYFEKMENNQKQIITLIETRDGLLPKLMSNEITIR